ncbi:unnamed protein product [Penicillium salamii]|uniref:Glycoside hydrolase family 5 domain-containing protein n=1 Tax=Penicillium salamii TaxID=1612424 RepID=A0A9W4N4Q5_9EURO|nr:unnamed protein product [Penicillium salamii]CAG7963612.1 unnamed protein product [Penicillium salamii]CAG7966990.1 unnamed protein product [Penicillium salamii]CAG7984760.1 unnamed protein product [Penicillium salamii]CAG8197018.1 unnamed protein product [Penicillium salamii]
MVRVLGISIGPQIAWALATLVALRLTVFKVRGVVPDVPVSHAISSSPASTNFTPPFHTSGRHILDSEGESIKLASINWYGASDVNFVPSGLDVRHRDEIAQLIKQLGFNSVRLPYADEVVVRNPVVNRSLLSANGDLLASTTDVGKPRALEVYHAVVESLTKAGLMVIVNNHITQATWCCGIDPCDIVWYNDWLAGGIFCRVPQSEEQWIRNWETIMQPLAKNPLVIGADLRNEPRGLWGTLDWDDWATAAERASERLLNINPSWLMIVEGISSANDLSGVRDRPIRLTRPNRVVYSAHVYKWSGWGQLYPFSKRSYPDFAAAMNWNWAYLLTEEIAPVWVGEFGTPGTPSAGDRNYWSHLVQFLAEVDISWGYWALNARKPTGDTESYGLVGDGWDWQSVRWDARLEDLRGLGLNFSL